MGWGLKIGLREMERAMSAPCKGNQDTMVAFGDQIPIFDIRMHWLWATSLLICSVVVCLFNNDYDVSTQQVTRGYSYLVHWDELFFLWKFVVSKHTFSRVLQTTTCCHTTQAQKFVNCCKPTHIFENSATNPKFCDMLWTFCWHFQVNLCVKANILNFSLQFVFMNT